MTKSASTAYLERLGYSPGEHHTWTHPTLPAVVWCGAGEWRVDPGDGWVGGRDRNVARLLAATLERTMLAWQERLTAGKMKLRVRMKP